MENSIIKQRIAVRAVIVRDDGKILLIRESEKYEGGTQIGLYDFPGGKIELGESFQDAIHREVFEEVGIKVKIGNPFHVGEWRPVIKGEQIQIVGIFFMCTPISDEIKLSLDHDNYIFISPEESLGLPLMKEALAAVNHILKEKLL